MYLKWYKSEKKMLFSTSIGGICHQVATPSQPGHEIKSTVFIY